MIVVYKKRKLIYKIKIKHLIWNERFNSHQITFVKAKWTDLKLEKIAHLVTIRMQPIVCVPPTE